MGADVENGPEMQKYQRLFSMGSAAEGAEASVLSTGSIRVPEQASPLVSSWPGYREGDWWVQDPSATLPALALYNELRGGCQSLEDLHVVDLCSAPGGKTAQLCAMGFGSVTAVEIAAHTRASNTETALKDVTMVLTTVAVLGAFETRFCARPSMIQFETCRIVEQQLTTPFWHVG